MIEAFDVAFFYFSNHISTQYLTRTVHHVLALIFQSKIDESHSIRTSSSNINIVASQREIVRTDEPKKKITCHRQRLHDGTI